MSVKAQTVKYAKGQDAWKEGTIDSTCQLIDRETKTVVDKFDSCDLNKCDDNTTKIGETYLKCIGRITGGGGESAATGKENHANKRKRRENKKRELLVAHPRNKHTFSFGNSASE